MRVVNQITFEAKDDAEALRLAAERLGKDAVILSTRVVKEGGFMGMFQKPVMKVTAGILEDDTPKEARPRPRDTRTEEDTRRETVMAFQKFMELKDLKERSSSAAGPSGTMGPSGPAVPPAPTGEEGYRPAGGTSAGSPDGDSLHISPAGLRSAYGLNAPNNNLNNNPPRPQAPQRQTQPQAQGQTGEGSFSQSDARLLKDQVGALSQRIDSLLERLAAVETGMSPRMPSPAFQAGFPGASTLSSFSSADQDHGLESRLRSSEVDEKYIRKLLADYGVSDRKKSFTEWLASRIECAGDNGGDASGGRKVMLLGPTGVGKTTTIAKLAAIKALWEHRKVLLLTSDTYRIAAVDQLKTYAKILGVPIEIIFEPGSIPSMLSEHENADIILLDTAGRAQRDRKSLEIFESLYGAFTPDAVHLVLAANMKYRDMLDVVEHIPNIPISHLLFTKLDETVSYGAIFNIQQVMGCPVSFLTVGQNVPRDIETASGSRIAEFLMKTEEERKRA